MRWSEGRNLVGACRGSTPVAAIDPCLGVLFQGDISSIPRFGVIFSENSIVVFFCCCCQEWKYGYFIEMLLVYLDGDIENIEISWKN